jgi:hypothetical protein
MSNKITDRTQDLVYNVPNKNIYIKGRSLGILQPL